MDRQKKWLHQNKTGRERGGGARGLAGLPWEAAEVPEGYRSSWGFPLRRVGSKPQARLLPQPTAPEPERNIQLWKAAGFLFARERWLDMKRASSRANTQIFVYRHLPWVPAEEGKSRLETLEETLGLAALVRELKEQPPGSLCWVIPHSAEAIFLKNSTPLQLASAWGEAIAPPTGVTLPYPVVLKQGCWLHLEATLLISLTTKVQNTKKQPKWEEKEMDP